MPDNTKQKKLQDRRFKKQTPSARSSEMPSVSNYIQMMGTHTLKETTGIVDAWLHGMDKRKNSPAERKIGRAQISRFILNPRKFRGGPAARKK